MKRTKTRNKGAAEEQLRSSWGADRTIWDVFRIRAVALTLLVMLRWWCCGDAAVMMRRWCCGDEVVPCPPSLLRSAQPETPKKTSPLSSPLYRSRWSPAAPLMLRLLLAPKAWGGGGVGRASVTPPSCNRTTWGGWSEGSRSCVWTVWLGSNRCHELSSFMSELLLFSELTASFTQWYKMFFTWGRGGPQSTPELLLVQPLQIKTTYWTCCSGVLWKAFEQLIS